MFKRILSMILATVFAMAVISSGLAEGSYASGDITMTALSESLEAGNQIHFTCSLDMEGVQNEQVKKLLDLFYVDGSYYLEDMGQRLDLSLLINEKEYVTLQALIMNNGSVQFMSNLTGSTVYLVPAGTETSNTGAVSGVHSTDPDFRKIPARQRVMICAQEATIPLWGSFLGWISSHSHHEEHEEKPFYWFDNDFIDATDTRDEVYQTMHSQARADEILGLPWNMLTTLDSSDCKELRVAVADFLAENGVTHRMLREVVDTLLTKEQMDPAEDVVVLTHALPDPDGPCYHDDIDYCLKKIIKSVETIWEESIDQNLVTLKMGYGESGNVVGLDIDMPRLSTEVPYEGSFHYSYKTDDDWQQHYLVAGDLLTYNDLRVVGTISAQDGEDVDGINENYLDMKLQLVNDKTGASDDLDLHAGIRFTASEDADATYIEEYDGVVDLTQISGEAKTTLANVTLTGKTLAQVGTMSTAAAVKIPLPEVGTLVLNVNAKQAPVEAKTFPGGEAVNILNIGKDELNKQIQTAATNLMMQAFQDPELMSALTGGN